MSDDTFLIAARLMPYPDGSGYRYRVRITSTDGSQPIIWLETPAGCENFVTVEACDWPKLRDEIDRLLAFTNEQLAP